MNHGANKNSLIITSTRRLARHLLRDIESVYHQTSGKTVWPTPQVMAYQDWILSCWQVILNSHPDVELPILMNDSQHRALWQQVVLSHEHHERLLSIRELAALAEQAWGTLRRWNLDLSCLSQMPLSRDAEMFVELAKTYLVTLAKKRLFPGHDLELHLISHQAILREAGAFPQEIILRGFDDIVPLMRVWLDILTSHGVNIVYEEIGVLAEGKVKIQPCADRQIEWQTAIHFAKLWNEEHQGTVAIVCPDLATHRDEIDKQLKTILAPWSLVNLTEQELPFTLSSGRSLAAEPIIHLALLLLKLIHEPLTPAELLTLLVSPFWQGASWANEGYALDAELRTAGFELISLALLIEFCPLDSPYFSLLKTLESFTQEIQMKQLPSVWAEKWASHLFQLGWPGPQSIDSAAYQAVQQYHEVMTSIASLDLVLPPISYDHALQLLNTALDERLFQMKAEDKPIQVLGVLEAAGIECDAIWCLGMTDTIWPNQPSPNPLLPLSIQREYAMPHACSERELHFAKVLTERFTHSAREIIFSFPQQEAGSPVGMSPLLKGYPIAPIINDGPNLTAAYVPLTLESFEDTIGTPYAGTTLARGSRVFTDMAACPFQAYARHRLHASTLSTPWQGLNPLERGILVHKALELFWREVKHHRRLQSLTEDKLSALLTDIVMQALAVFTARRVKKLDQFTADIESNRLHILLKEWIAQERARDEFKVIGIEQALSTEIQGVTMSFRIDRIDKLAAGDYVLIDYKTSPRTIVDWVGERPYDPQLPLYQVIIGDKVTALAFAEVVRHHCRFRGLAQDKMQMNGIKPVAQLKTQFPSGDWATVQAEWSSTIQGLFNQFLAGDARVQPKNQAQTCERCDYHGLCRVAEQKEWKQ